MPQTPIAQQHPHAPVSTPAPTLAALPEDIARARLHGTLWERSDLAVSVYRESIGLGRWMGSLGVAPDTLTYASLALAAGAGVAAAMGWLLTSGALVLVSGLFDVLDGVVARATGRSSRFGALLDSTIDRLSDGFPLLGLVVFYAGWGPAVLAPGLALLASLTVSYIRARAEGLGATLPPLYMRRAERVLMLSASLAAGSIHLGGALPAPVTFAGVALIAVLGAVGAIGALRAAHTALAAPAPSGTKQP